MVDFRNFQFLQKIKNEQQEEVTKNWNSVRDNKSVLLDNGSTCSCCNNPKMFTDIRKCKIPINSIINIGVMVTDMEGDLLGFFPVYSNPKSLMNIISLSDMRKRFRITVDTDNKDAIMVHIGEGQVMQCLEIGVGLYIWKPGHNFNLLNKQISFYSFLSLVSTKKSNFTKRELARIDETRKLYINIGICWKGI